MHISFIPCRRDAAINIVRQGDTLIIDGEPFDFSELPEGATLPAKAIASDFFVGPVTRTSGELSLTLKLPCTPNSPEETRFPKPIHVTEDGPLGLPQFTIEDPEPEAEAEE